MRKLLAVAIIGLLLLSVSPVNAHDSSGSSSSSNSGHGNGHDDDDDDDDDGAGNGGGGAGGGAGNGGGGADDGSDDGAGNGSGNGIATGAVAGTGTGAGANRPEDEPEFRDRSGGSDDTFSVSNTHDSAYEGIWSLNGLGANWIGATVSGNKIILLKYEPNKFSSALAGALVGNTAFLGFATDASSFAAKLTLMSSVTAILEIHRCEAKPNLTCSFPAGSRFGLTKVFE